AWLVINDQDGPPGQEMDGRSLRGVDIGAPGHVGNRHGDAEHRPRTDLRGHVESMSQLVGQAPDDVEAEAKSRARRGQLELEKLEEDVVEPALGNSDARVPDLDRQLAAASPAA